MVLTMINHDFVIYIVLPMSQLQTQQLMTSQIKSHIEYLIQTYSIFVLILYSKLMRNIAALEYNCIQFNMMIWLTF